MTYKRLLFFSGILICFSLTQVRAQLAENALRFGEIGSFGSARIQGIGGAGYSLGGDVSAAAINPAGLGFFNRSIMVFTPTFNYSGGNAQFLDQNQSIGDTHAGISNFGIIFNKTDESLTPSDWRGGSFSITYNRFSRSSLDFSFGPGNNDFSMIDDFAAQANDAGVTGSQLEDNVTNGIFTTYADAGYYNYLINPDNTDQNYVPSIPEGVIADQNGSISESTTVSEWDFAYGGNYKDKLYLGASIGFRSFAYQRRSTFEEYYLYPQEYQDFINAGGYYFPVEDGDISVDYVNYNRLDESQTISGTGINASLGVIYRPINEVTIGLTYHTPTVYGVTEDYQYSFGSDVSGIIDPNTSNGETPFDLVENGSGAVDGNPVLTNYRLTTPSKVGAGITYFFQKYGFLTADVEYVNYRSSQFNSGEFSTGYLNDEIDQFFQSSINYKVGGEYRYNIFRARLGYALYSSGTQYPGDELNRNRTVMSAGIGVSLPKFFADLAVTNTSYGSEYRPYIYSSYFPLEGTTLDNSITQAALSIGFNF